MSHLDTHKCRLGLVMYRSPYLFSIYTCTDGLPYCKTKFISFCVRLLHCVVIVCIAGSPCEESPSPCNNHGNCTVKDDGSSQCGCTPGWNGTSCEHGKGKNKRNVGLMNDYQI